MSAPVTCAGCGGLVPRRVTFGEVDGVLFLLPVWRVSRFEGVPAVVERVAKAPAPEKPKRKGRSSWPDLSEKRVRDLIKSAPFRMADLVEASPDGPETLGPYDLARALFCCGRVENPWLCVAWNAWQPVSRRVSDWQGEFQAAPPLLVVPSLMRGKEARTKDGMISARALANVLERRFQVVAVGFGEGRRAILEAAAGHGLSAADVAATVIVHLAGRRPLALVVEDEGRAEAWFPVGYSRRRALSAFFREACRLGADPGMGLPHQWARFPAPGLVRFLDAGGLKR